MPPDQRYLAEKALCEYPGSSYANILDEVERYVRSRTSASIAEHLFR